MLQFKEIACGFIAVSLLTITAGPTPAFSQVNTPPASDGHPIVATYDNDRLTPACLALKTYFERIVQKRFGEVGALFSETVDYIGPDGQYLTKNADITAMYASMKDWKRQPSPEITRVTPAEGNECFVEVTIPDSKTGQRKLMAIDHVSADKDGKINWFRPYFLQPFNKPRDLPQGN